MRNLSMFVVAALAAGAIGMVGCSSTSAGGPNSEYRLARNSEGGNAPQTYNYVRSDASRETADAPYALAGRQDRRYTAVTNEGGNGRTVNLVPQAD